MSDITDFMFGGIEFKGHVKPLKRLKTGLYSFDKAFIDHPDGEIGFPLSKIVELFGLAGVGKSTTVYSLSAIIAKHLGGNIALADLEDFDPIFVGNILSSLGYNGHVYSILEGRAPKRGEDEIAMDELGCDELINSLWLDDPVYSVGILDAIGSISPLSERQGETGKANMGRRGRIMAQFNRKALHVTRAHEKYKSLFLVNHWYPDMGGYGYVAPGGEVKSYAASIRIKLARAKFDGKRKFDDGSYLVKGTIKKNSWGLDGREFILFVLAGAGVHKGLTALFDCAGERHITKASIKDKRRNIVLDDQKMGKFHELLEEAHQGNNEVFEPFKEKLYGKIRTKTNKDISNQEEKS